VQTDLYDDSKLPELGQGTYGVVYNLGNKFAAKLYYDRPDDGQSRKLAQLIDLGNALDIDPAVALTAAMPLRPAQDPNDNGILGYSMRCFDGWQRFSALSYSADQRQYQQANGFRFNDSTAVKAIFGMFGTLHALARRRVTIGDISSANILVDTRTGTPGFIDLDSAHFQDWESGSVGTDGYVDPRLLEGDLNSLGGYHFDAQSDVFALTVAAFLLVTGIKPFFLPVSPPQKSDDFLRNRISSLKILREGVGCLKRYGLSLADDAFVRAIGQRLDVIGKIPGASGKDGAYLCQHFFDVFVDDQRENLLELLPDNDQRNPIGAVLGVLRSKEALDELDEMFRRRTAAAPEIQVSVVGKTGIYRASDPKSFEQFISARNISFDMLVAA
jgi:serine/threonine protein kinase